MMSYYLPRLLYIRQQKCHVQRQRQDLFLAAYVVVTKLYQMIYVAFLGMAQNGLGALGIAGMWEAVFGDVGVTIIAVLNAMRILKK